MIPVDLWRAYELLHRAAREADENTIQDALVLVVCDLHRRIEKLEDNAPPKLRRAGERE